MRGDATHHSMAWYSIPDGVHGDALEERLLLQRLGELARVRDEPAAPANMRKVLTGTPMPILGRWERGPRHIGSAARRCGLTSSVSSVPPAASATLA